MSGPSLYDLTTFFTHHPPHSNQVERYEDIRKMALGFANHIFENCPESPERTTAVNKLREVVMWANASIACNEAE